MNKCIVPDPNAYNPLLFLPSGSGSLIILTDPDLDPVLDLHPVPGPDLYLFIVEVELSEINAFKIKL